MAIWTDGRRLVLTEVVPIEEAEGVLQAIFAARRASEEREIDLIDLSACVHAHTAVVQILLASGLPVLKPLGDGPFAKTWRLLGPRGAMPAARAAVDEPSSSLATLENTE
jgi:hypothetical protein